MSKTQIPMTNEIPKLKLQAAAMTALEFGILDLVIHWNLEIGALWFLPLPQSGYVT